MLATCEVPNKRDYHYCQYPHHQQPGRKSTGEGRITALASEGWEESQTEGRGQSRRAFS